MENQLPQFPPAAAGIDSKWLGQKLAFSFFLVVLLLIMGAPGVLAQQVTLTGKVTSEDGEGLPFW
jgi:hypothetical protein